MNKNMPPMRDCMGGVEFMLYFFVGLTERDGGFVVGQKTEKPNRSLENYKKS
jgi:hypothetical protein